MEKNKDWSNHTFDKTFGHTFQEDQRSVESKIRHIIEHQWKPDADYMFYNWAQANAEIRGIKRPVIVYVLPASGSLYPLWNQTIDRPVSLIAFLCKTDFDFKTRENDRLMQHMKELASQFIQEVNKSGLFESIPQKEEIPYQAVYDYLDENVTGIMITIRLKPLKGIPHCPI